MTMTSLNEMMKAKGFGEKLKLGGGFVIGIAADIAITALLKGHMPVRSGAIKWLTRLGIFAIAMKVGEDVENYFYKVCDDARSSFEEAKKEAEKAVEEAIAEEKDVNGH